VVRQVKQTIPGAKQIAKGVACRKPPGNLRGVLASGLKKLTKIPRSYKRKMVEKRHLLKYEVGVRIFITNFGTWREEGRIEDKVPYLKNSGQKKRTR